MPESNDPDEKNIKNYIENIPKLLRSEQVTNALNSEQKPKLSRIADEIEDLKNLSTEDKKMGVQGISSEISKQLFSKIAQLDSSNKTESIDNLRYIKAYNEHHNKLIQGAKVEPLPDDVSKGIDNIINNPDSKSKTKSTSIKAGFKKAKLRKGKFKIGERDNKEKKTVTLGSQRNIVSPEKESKSTFVQGEIKNKKAVDKEKDTRIPAEQKLDRYYNNISGIIENKKIIKGLAEDQITKIQGQFEKIKQVYNKDLTPEGKISEMESVSKNLSTQFMSIANAQGVGTKIADRMKYARMYNEHHADILQGKNPRSFSQFKESERPSPESFKKLSANIEQDAKTKMNLADVKVGAQRAGKKAFKQAKKATAFTKSKLTIGKRDNQKQTTVKLGSQRNLISPEKSSEFNKVKPDKTKEKKSLIGRKEAINEAKKIGNWISGFVPGNKAKSNEKLLGSDKIAPPNPTPKNPQQQKRSGKGR